MYIKRALVTFLKGVALGLQYGRGNVKEIAFCVVTAKTFISVENWEVPTKFKSPVAHLMVEDCSSIYLLSPPD
jgi:hypothetical protein